MIRVAGEEGECAVELLAENDARQLVGQGHGAEREHEPGAAARVLGPTVGGADCEDDPLAALVALAAEPLGERFRGHRPGALVEQDQERRRASAFMIERVEERLFGAEERGVDGVSGRAGEEFGDAVEIEPGQCLEGRTGAGADGGDGELHNGLPEDSFA